MYKLLGISALFILGLSPSDKIPVEPFPEITSSYPLNWRCETGNASFRTNVAFTGDYIVMGSNGHNFMDYHSLDKASGIYIISRKTGKVIRKIAGEQIGDMDVNGVLLKGNLIYFGNDNEEFQCMTLDGKLVWRIPVSGDVEHEPVEMDINGRKAIVFSSEMGEVRAVEPSNGKTIWTYYIPNFSGWKEGQNRTVFKIGSFFSNTIAFYTKPEVVDLNKDGTQDLFFLGYHHSAYAINGKTGKALWTIGNDDLSHGLMAAVHFVDGEPLIKLFESEYKLTERESYNYLTTINRFGKRIERVQVFSPFMDGSLNSINLEKNKLVLSSCDSLMIIQPKAEIIKIDRAIPYRYINYNNDTVKSIRNSYHPLIGTSAFTHPEYGKCVVVLNQFDGQADHGFVEIISIDRKKVVQKFSIPARSEMPPIVEDVNKDGIMDLMINGHDGFTYCYSLESKR